MPLKFGAMNNPARDVLDEVRALIELDLDYLELTVEWPGASLERVREVRGDVLNLLSTRDLDVVVHAPWYLEIASPYEGVRDGAMRYAEGLLDLAAELDAPFVTVHPYTPGWLARYRDEARRLNLDAMRRLVAKGVELGVRVHVENVDHGAFSSVSDILYLLGALPELGFTLDLGHAFLGGVEKVQSYIEKAGGRILHVHAHDNYGKGDDHMPVGAGRIPWERVLSDLRRMRYEGTVTLEIHSSDLEYVEISRRKFLEYWERAGGSGE